eukprot:CAMPEP_0206620766 /NCGR_PEP_ID=MMETSP0325_2-20121206/61826_1 /ASSEMBLY_ACC=CAM_ASM_000347 /TAXON_ID=2866 /ORGANISM="Crypthecodinium cohnii, Strain Seligo" /LENGTH=60 /DNA_ID=CAMNT_0054143803 /DNA_START=129 /DNA_END=307 /DNA_ORIENTATION=+
MSGAMQVECRLHRVISAEVATPSSALHCIERQYWEGQQSLGKGPSLATHQEIVADTTNTP